MEHRTGHWRAADGTQLFTQQWLPDESPRAAVFLIHGLAEHSGRYAHVAAFFTARGLAVYSMDLRGHGQSEGLRGYVDSFGTYLDDLYGYFQQVRQEYPAVKAFVMGHSMGGALAINFAARYERELAGLITSGAAVNLGDAVPGYLKAVSGLLSRVAPRLPLMAVPAETVSRDPAVKAAYDSDPLNYRGKVSARLGEQLLAMGEAACQRMPQMTLPALIMQGGADALVSPTSLETIKGLLGSPDKTTRLFDGLYHEILNEPEQDMVMTTIVDWILARV